MTESYESAGGIALRIRLRNWLLMKLAGKSPIMLNCHLSIIDRREARLALTSECTLLSHCDFVELQSNLHETEALLIKSSREEES